MSVYKINISDNCIKRCFLKNCNLTNCFQTVVFEKLFVNHLKVVKKTLVNLTFDFDMKFLFG